MEKHNLLIVSDLHLSAGLDPKSGKFSHLEDFLFDDAFALLTPSRKNQGTAQLWRPSVDADSQRRLVRLFAGGLTCLTTFVEALAVRYWHKSFTYFGHFGLDNEGNHTAP